jgi:hypothetical protein
MYIKSTYVILPMLAALTMVLTTAGFAGTATQQAAAQTRWYISGSGTGTLQCSTGATFENTQIAFNADIKADSKFAVKAVGKLTLTTQSGEVIQGKVLAAPGWDPNGINKDYTLTGPIISSTTSACLTSDVTNVGFTISGIIGPEGPITLDGKEYGTFTGTVQEVKK